MITEVDYTRQVKRVVAELISPLSQLDQLDILLRAMSNVPIDKVEKILEILGYELKEVTNE